MFTYDLTNFNFDDHIDFLIDTAKAVKKGKITVLTGPNGYGKSFLRKLVGSLSSKYNFPKVASISMEMRTNAKEDFSALKSIMMDGADDATSNHSCHMLRSIFKSATDRYIIIDEPEIGMGKEILLGYIQELNEEIQKQKDSGTFLGIMIITHSEFFIENFNHDIFLNLENLTYEQWKNREVKAIAPKALSEWSHKMWLTIEKRLKN